jgi:hypothetical protein
MIGEFAASGTAIPRHVAQPDQQLLRTWFTREIDLDCQ